MKTHEELVDLADEIETCREFIRKAEKDNNGSLFNALAVTLSKLTREQSLQKIRFGELVSRDAVIRIGKQCGMILANELRQLGLPNFEDSVDRVASQILQAIDSEIEETKDRNGIPRIEYDK